MSQGQLVDPTSKVTEGQEGRKEMKESGGFEPGQGTSCAAAAGYSGVGSGGDVGGRGDENGSGAGQAGTQGQGSSASGQEWPPDRWEVDWNDVVFTKNPSAFVTHYFPVNGLLPTLHNDEDVNKHVQLMKTKIDLAPGTMYSFRVAAVNSCGIGPWSEVSTFKTMRPDLPEPPGGIGIFKVEGGVKISWEPTKTPLENTNILEYSVYIEMSGDGVAVEGTSNANVPTSRYERVYCSKENSCVIPNLVFQNAHLNQENPNKPSYTLRICAKNEKGYGPATQIRWVQDPWASTTNSWGLKPMLGELK